MPKGIYKRKKKAKKALKATTKAASRKAKRGPGRPPQTKKQANKKAAAPRQSQLAFGGTPTIIETIYTFIKIIDDRSKLIIESLHGISDAIRDNHDAGDTNAKTPEAPAHQETAPHESVPAQVS